jgi:PIN domain nuclease of toxin-antitoxin system
MRILLDTHALIWWLGNPSKLSRRASAIIANQNNTILVSAAIAWELAIKVNLGKFDGLSLTTELPRYTAEEGFEELSISMEQAVRAGLLPLHHRDPFDRMLVAQAQALNAPILSADPVLDQYDVKRLW